MGCFQSKAHARETNSHIFRVHNVDDLGAEISPGKIEVTESDLILYQRGKEPILWPLRCLRRYGFDEELFSFESGRRCATGSGIYAFKCRRAEELFSLVQEAIQSVGQQSHLRSQPLVNGTGTLMPQQNSRPTSMVDPHEPSGIYLSVRGRVAVVPNDQHLYMNGSVVPQEESGPNYINTNPNRADAQRRESIDQTAALIDFLHNPPVAPAPPAPPVREETVNYADLDLPGSSENIFDQAEGTYNTDNTQHQDRYGLEMSIQSSDGQDGLEMDEVAINCDTDVFSENEASLPNYINLNADGRIKEEAAVNIHVDKSRPSRPSDLPHNGSAKLLPVRRMSVEQNYANLGIGSFNVCPEPNNPTPIQASASGGSSNGANRLSSPGELNYIEIDVNKTEGDNTPGVITPSSMSASYCAQDSKRTESYAMIDINRTLAISNSSKAVSDDDQCVRKTRHNSTIS